MPWHDHSYESYYGVGLLDDLHNYFPALLYEPSAFHSVRDVLDYISSRTRRRFDLYSNAVNNYQGTPVSVSARVPAPAPAPAPAPVRFASGIPNQYTAPSSYAPTAPPVPRNTVQFPITPNVLTALLAGMADQNSVEDSIYQILLRPSIPRVPRNFMEPIVVRPTQEQIAAATFLGTPNDPTEVCAICQETIEDNQPARLINYCEHWFHTNCIDVWFQQNVHCPVCRHDIRIVADVSGNAIPEISTEARGSRTRTTSIDSNP
jgi:hypothetical protein